jgi:photosystem II stability/assembly factor-like uncharacterized protein
MRLSNRIRCLWLLLLLLAGNDSVFAQWKNLAPNLISTAGRAGAGVITYSSGKIWAAVTTTIWMSPDEGKTWQIVPAPIDPSKNNMISDIDFYDANIGIVSSINGDACITRDGGQTWTVIKVPGFTLAWQAKFVASPTTIVAFAIGNPDLNVLISLDGGTTWNPTNPFPPHSNLFINHIIVRKKDSSIYVLADQAGDGSTIDYTSDNGTTWKQTSTFYTDCYSLALDPCFDNTFYVMNEGTVQVEPDNKGRIFTSVNRGGSFTPANLQSSSYYAGSLVCAPAGTLYAQTQTTDGVIRSTDRGATWKSIGGPSGFFDCHFIYCKDDNTIFALDTFGSVWVTYNSGGDSLKGLPVPNLSISADSLFVQDSLTVCDPPLQRFFDVTTSGCSPPHIAKSEIIGVDSLSYFQIPASGNTLGVTFTPQHPGAESALLVMTLTDGAKDTIVLRGYRRPSYNLSLATKDQSTDTIGGGVAVPISIQNLDATHDVEISLHFTPDLIYLGSSSTAGNLLDIPLQQWQGRTRLHIPNASTVGLQGYANFLFLTDSAVGQSVWLDSMTILDQTSPCEYNTGNVATSIVTAPAGCGIKTISTFMRSGNVPKFTIHPNPAENVLTIESSVPAGAATLEIFDMLGRKIESLSQNFLLQAPKAIDISILTDGKYFLRIEGEHFLNSIPFVVCK